MGERVFPMLLFSVMLGVRLLLGCTPLRLKEAQFKIELNGKEI